MNVEVFSERQNKTSDTDRYKGYFFTGRVSQVNVSTMKRIFEQQSQLQVAKSLIVHVLSGSYNVSRHELRTKKKARQQWIFRVANDFRTQSGQCISRDSVCVQCKKILVCEVLLFLTLLQIHYQNYFRKCVPDLY